ncbi:MAG: membrane protein insertase YidC [Phycisphaerales bacterium]|nr:membrane protein insertase YidC [Phycisphaerales bacterium]
MSPGAAAPPTFPAHDLPTSTMPKRPNTLARVLVPLALGLVAVAVAFAVLKNTKNARNPSPSQASEVQPTPEAPAAGSSVTGAPDAASSEPEARNPPDPQPTAQGPADSQPPGVEESPAPPAIEGSLVVEAFEGVESSAFTPLGGLGLDSPFAMQVEFSHVGAGIKSIRLARELDSVKADRAAKAGAVEPEHHVEVQGQVASARQIIVPMAALAIEIDGRMVALTRAPGDKPAWRQVAADQPGHFEAFVLDDKGDRVLRLDRQYSLPPGSYDLQLRQSAENLTERRLSIRWRTFGPIDMARDALGYGGEKRRLRFGYLLDAKNDPTRQWVDASDFLWSRMKLVGRDAPKNFPGGQVWPNTRSVERKYDLVWAGLTNRYFAAVVHPLIDPTDTNPAKAFAGVERVDRVMLPGEDALVLSLAGPVQPLAPHAYSHFDMGLYSGPLNRETIGTDAMLNSLGVPGIVVFNFGGMCAICTFTWLTTPLLSLLRILHGLTFDWALAIILLVVCVRSLLHPITRWSQIRMQKFGKQMQAMAPKQKAIQEKYKDDKQRLQQEMGKLWREEGVSPAGFLGCLPMMFQSPVWIALYATLYFAIDLRHEPAFFGIFQSATNNAWPFLADLAEPDHAIFFGGHGIKVPLMGQVSSINLLPLLLGVVFYLQQKYLTPPTAGAMSPEQESQQKMMKVMMVVMFPLMMYNAPSGLALYFITNSTLGILESRWIRSHVEKSGMLDPENLKKKPKEGGFLSRLRQMAAEQQQTQAGRGMSPKRQPRVSRETDPSQRKFKKR